MQPVVAFLGTWELIVISIVALLLFGKRLPEVARSMGRGIVEFKRGLKEVEAEVKAVDSGEDYRSRRQIASPAEEEATNPEPAAKKEAVQ